MTSRSKAKLLSRNTNCINQAHFMAHERLEPHWVLYQYGGQCQHAFNQLARLPCWDWKVLLSLSTSNSATCKS